MWLNLFYINNETAITGPFYPRPQPASLIYLNRDKQWVMQIQRRLSES